ncbi:MAG: hypothetical protein JNJ73_17415 [Hyphomonadaceae bacterium]|nr:hypothetical protein [Hyphomonadaceae bacterium]
MIRPWAVVLAGLCAHTPAFAESLFDGDQLRGFLELRAVAADGERSWMRDGFGKTRFGGGGEEVVGAGLATGLLVWRPHLSWSLDGYVSLQADSQALPALDAVEAYLSYRGPPRDGWRWGARAGVFYPPVSLEHGGIGWTPTETITPSAINSWIGEEVKIGGVEVTARRSFADQEVEATGALFGFNDTAGTLIAFRGWALGDVMPGLRGKAALPPTVRQFDTEPTTELDGRIGYFGRLLYQPIGSLTLDISHYDNAGDRMSDKHGQTNWETRFTNLSLRFTPTPDVRILAQAMTGQTVWGNLTPRGYWSDVDFSAAYALLARDFGAHTLSARMDVFSVDDNSRANPADNGEEGWALTAAYLVDLWASTRLAFEGLHVASDRPGRVNIGAAPQQRQTTVQSSLKMSF